MDVTCIPNKIFDLNFRKKRGKKRIRIVYIVPFAAPYARALAVKTWGQLTVTDTS